MSKTIKKVGLLKDSDKPKKPTAASASSAIDKSAAQQSLELLPPLPSKADAAPRSMKSTMIVLVALVMLLILLPKPQLLHYGTLQMSTTSIYWSGLFGYGEGLIDSHQRVLLDEERQEMYLCFPNQKKEECTKYRIKQQQGMIAAFVYWLNH
jgi:hypothetical protein